ncbi:hypothetical protein IT411_02810 [Candidatus Peregrinibacteria bacterium]|nr:hypothetical protein [Candidatus Peregrinibacteria bacterium]
MDKRILWRDRLFNLLVFFVFGCLGGFLAFSLANNFYGKLPVPAVTEKVTEKHVYIESSSIITALNDVSDSLLRIMSSATLKSWQSGDESVLQKCFGAESDCYKTAIMLNSEGMALLPQEIEQNADWKVVDQKGLIYQYEVLGKYNGLSLIKLVKDGELAMDKKSRTPFYNFRAVDLAHQYDWQVGQMVLAVKAMLATQPHVQNGVISALMGSFDDKYPYFYEDGKNPVIVFDDLEDLNSELIFDYSGRLLAIFNENGELITGPQISWLLERYGKNGNFDQVATLGLSCFELNKTLAQSWKVAVDSGCVITDSQSLLQGKIGGGIVKDGLAQKLDLRSGDVIVEIDGLSAKVNQIQAVMGKKVKGDKLILRIYRNGKTQDLSGTI